LLRTWRDPEKVTELASIVIISRPGAQAPQQTEFVEAGLDGGRFTFCGLQTTPDVSGSAVRRAIGRGESVAGKVPVQVERYIAMHHLYADNRAS
jgi:nicotinic acid mononucleotide adenylyltransferase